MRKTAWIIIWTLAVLLVLSGGVYLFGCSYSIYHPRTFSQPQFDRIITWMKTKKAPANGSAVILPPDLAPLSVTGRVYITDGMVFIPSWVGRQSWIVAPGDREGDQYVEGFVYSKAALPVKTGDCFVDLNAPAPCSPWAASHDTGVAVFPGMFVGSRVGQHWYTAGVFS